MTVAQGWYADPWDAACYRWWDGSAWTEHRQPIPQPRSPPLSRFRSLRRRRNRATSAGARPRPSLSRSGAGLLERLADLQAIGGFALDIDYTKVRISDDARSWYLGALGERRVGKLLEQLGPEWTVLHSVPVGSSTSDIDHIVIGPGGVFTINAKNHSGATVSADAHRPAGERSEAALPAEHHERGGARGDATVAGRPASVFRSRACSRSSG